MKRYASPSSCCRSAIRFSTCACTETSSADTGSSATTSAGSQHQRARDRDALALAAGEHVRVAVVVLGTQAHLGEHRARTRSRSAGPAASVLMVSGASRIAPILLRGLSDAVRVLEHHLHRSCAAACVAGVASTASTRERSCAAAGGLEQRDHACERRLAAPGLADDGERAAGLDGERDAADRLQLRRRSQQPAADLVDARQVARLRRPERGHASSRPHARPASRRDRPRRAPDRRADSGSGRDHRPTAAAAGARRSAGVA